MSESVPHLAVVMAAYNRKEQTLACLRVLHAQDGAGRDFTLSVHLTDDGGRDGTRQAVGSDFPGVDLLVGDGTLYWNGAMRCAIESAALRPFDFLLWLNDDVGLKPDAVQVLLKTCGELRSRLGVAPIVVGCLCDPESGRTTYGGLRRACPVFPLKMRRLESEAQPLACDAFNGNVVLVPAAVYARLGNLESGFTHHMGDWDYGLRAKRAGIPVFTAAGHVGTCRRNPEAGNYLDPRLPMRQRWRAMLGPKGIPPQEVLLYARRHGGWLWPLWLALKYAWFFVRWLVQGAVRCLRSQRGGG